MREIHKITLTDIGDVKRMKAIDVISAALVAQYHKNVMVIQEGHASASAIDALPPSVSVFLICSEKPAQEVMDIPEFLYLRDGVEIKVGEIESSAEDNDTYKVSDGRDHQ